MKHKKSPRSNRIAYILLTIVMVAALLLAGVIVGIDLVDMFRARMVSAQVQGMYRSSAANEFQFFLMGRAHADAALPDAAPEDAPASASPPPIQQDFALLYERNPDIIGWLTAGGDIDLPVVQRDNEYYLSHNFFGETDSNGTVFLNEMNAFWPRDQVLLIHGHNMNSGAMFGKLGRYADEAFMRDNALLTFRTIYDAQESYYVPIAAFDASMLPEADGYFDITAMNFATVQEHRAYLEQVLARSYWSAPVDVTEDDELLVLITCSYSYEDGRFLLLCRKLRGSESPDQMCALYTAN